MSKTQSSAFKDRTTWFTARLKPSQNVNSQDYDSANSATDSTRFEDDRDYSCIPNPKTNSILLSDTTFSGRILNNYTKGKDESTQNRFFFKDSTEKYDFDKVYTDHCEQDKFYNENAYPLVNQLLQGENALVVAYGPRGSGKSHLMREYNRYSESQEGLVLRFAKDLIPAAKNQGLVVNLTVVQIYKDWIVDLLRSDTDIGQYLNESEEPEGMSSLQMDSFEQFSEMFSEALQRGEANSNITTRDQSKFHLIARLVVLEKDDSDAGLNVTNLNSTIRKRLQVSRIDFVDPVASSFIFDENRFDQSEKEWLEESFGSLSNLLTRTYSTQPDTIHLKPNTLTDFLEDRAGLIEERLLFICCLSPEVDDIQKNRSALEYSVRLRSQILHFGERAIDTDRSKFNASMRSFHNPLGSHRGSVTTQSQNLNQSVGRSQHNIQNQPNAHGYISFTPGSLEVDIDGSVEKPNLEYSFSSKYKVLKDKLLSNNGFSSNDSEELRQWASLQERDLDTFESETRFLFAGDISLPSKLHDLTQLRNELQFIKSKYRRSHPPSNSTRSITPESSRRNSEHTRGIVPPLSFRKDSELFRHITEEPFDSTSRGSKSSARRRPYNFEQPPVLPSRVPSARSSVSYVDGIGRGSVASTERGAVRNEGLMGQVKGNGYNSGKPKKELGKRERQSLRPVEMNINDNRAGEEERGLDASRGSIPRKFGSRRDSEKENGSRGNSVQRLREREHSGTKGHGSASGRKKSKSRVETELKNEEEERMGRDEVGIMSERVRGSSGTRNVEKSTRGEAKRQRAHYEEEERESVRLDGGANAYIQASYVNTSSYGHGQGNMHYGSQNASISNSQRQSHNSSQGHTRTSSNNISILPRMLQRKESIVEPARHESHQRSVEIGDYMPEQNFLQSQTSHMPRQSLRHDKRQAQNDSQIQESVLESDRYYEGSSQDQNNLSLSTKRRSVMPEQRGSTGSQMDVICELRSQLHQLSLEVKAQREQLNMEKEKNKELSSQQMELEREAMRMRHERDAMEMEMQARVTMHEKFGMMNRGLEAAQEENYKLQNEVIRLDKNNVVIAEELNQKELTIKELKAQLDKYRDQEKETQRQAKKIEKLRLIREELQDENEALNMKMEKMQREMKDLEHKATKAEARARSETKKYEAIKQREILEAKIRLAEGDNELRARMQRTEDRVALSDIGHKENGKIHNATTMKIERRPSLVRKEKENYK